MQFNAVNETEKENQYLQNGDAAEMSAKSKASIKANMIEEAGASINELNGDLAALLHMLCTALKSVLVGKLGHLNSSDPSKGLKDSDPFKERVRVGLLFVATYMREYLDMIQPGFKAYVDLHRIRNLISSDSLYQGPMAKVEVAPAQRTGFACCHHYAKELVTCSMKCQTAISHSAWRGKRHRAVLTRELKYIEKNIEVKVQNQKLYKANNDHRHRRRISRDQFTLVQKIFFYYLSLNTFISENEEICVGYFKHYGCQLKMVAAVKRSLRSTQQESIRFEPLAYALLEIVDSLRFFAVKTRDIQAQDQKACNEVYVEMVKLCMTSHFMFDPFSDEYKKILAGKKPDIEEFIAAWKGPSISN